MKLFLGIKIGAKPVETLKSSQNEFQKTIMNIKNSDVDRNLKCVIISDVMNPWSRRGLCNTIL